VIVCHTAASGETTEAAGVTSSASNLASIIEDHPGDAVALIEGDMSMTFAELRDQTATCRAALAARNVGPGSRIVLAAGNEIGFVVTALAALGLGAQVAPINPYSPAPEARRKLPPLNAELLVFGETADRLDDGGYDIPTISTGELLAEGNAAGDTAPPPVAAVADDDVSFLLSTSGVSGVPKVAMLTHGGMAWVQQSLIGDGDQQLRPTDISLGVLPVAHILGLNIAVLAALRAGAAVVLQRRFDSRESLELIARHGVTMVVGAPPMWHQWAAGAGAPENGPSDAMATVRFARSGAAALRPATVDRLERIYGVRVTQGYGLTETSAVVTTGRGVDAPITSVGRALPDIALVLVDDNGAPVDVGDVGEVVIRTPGKFAGYLDDEITTEMVLTDDGWFWTGDLGVLDDDGFLHLVDRVKNIVIVSGFNVYPAEVEDVILQFPGVRAAVVVGKAHGVTGETVCAHVAGDVNVDELDAWVRSQLSTYKCPTDYQWVDQVPQTPTGKTLRHGMQS
jgi:long-chain acyl-CoA synthetase